MKQKHQQRLLTIYKELNWNQNNIHQFKNTVGGTNITYFIEYDSIKYVIRIASDMSFLLGIDRKAEKQVTKFASDKNIGLKLKYFNVRTGDMVTYFEEGTILEEEDIKREENLHMLIVNLKLLHAQSISYIFNPIVDIENRRLEIDKFVHLKKRNVYFQAMKIFDSIKRQYISIPITYWGLCHNDPNRYNMILNSDLKLIDYEYSAMGNIFYDLACVCGLWEREDILRVFNKYFTVVKDEYWEYVYYATLVQLIWNGTWAYLKSLEKSDIKIDFLSCADELFEKTIVYYQKNIK